MSRFGRGRWYAAVDRLLGLDNIGDHQGQVIFLLDEVREWLLEIALVPHDSLVGIIEEVLVSIDFQSDHAALY